MVVHGAVVPHAPLLLPELAVPEVADAAAGLCAAAASLAEHPVDLWVLLSPHGRSSCVYEQASGSLAGFGVPAVWASVPPAAGPARELSRAWGRELSSERADHGITVPLLLIDRLRDQPVVACALEDPLRGGTDIDDDADALVRALRALAADKDIGVIASAHTAAALNARAPLTYLQEAEELHGAIVAALEKDLSALATIPVEQWRRAGSCGRGPFLVLAEFFAGRGGKVLATAAPVGVGYVVAEVSA